MMPLSEAEIESGIHYIAYVDIVKVVPGRPRAHARDLLRVTVKDESSDGVATKAIQHLKTYRGDSDHG